MHDESPQSQKRAEERIEALAGRLPREMSMATDLWPRIAARIDARSASHTMRVPAADIDPPSDLWPGIRAHLSTRDGVDGSMPRATVGRFPGAIAAGLLAVSVLATLLVTGIRDRAGSDGLMTVAVVPDAVPAATAPPDWMAQIVGQFADADAGTQAARLGETARAVQRDYLMVRSERHRIERAMSGSPQDTNLREQWRYVYVTELRLMDEVQRLGNFPGVRRTI